MADKAEELAREIALHIKDWHNGIGLFRGYKTEADLIAALLREHLGERADAYMCPVKCGCLWCNNHDGTMSLFGPNSKSCEVCEVLSLDKLIPLKRVTATTEQPEGAEWKPDSMHANAAPFLGNCETPHFLGEPTPDRKALTQIPHHPLPQNLCKNWRPLPAPPKEGEGR